MSIPVLVQSFVRRVVLAVEASTAARLRQAVLGALRGGVRRGPGRSPKSAFAAAPAAAPKRKRRKGPKQLCPVPGCKNPAAPVFGMVCKRHKDVPKAKIREYRIARHKAKAAK